jgi:hypothetical protein
MDGSILWVIIVIAAIVFIVYAVFVSTDPTVQAWGYVILGVVLVLAAIYTFIEASNLFKVPRRVTM